MIVSSQPCMLAFILCPRSCSDINTKAFGINLDRVFFLRDSTSFELIQSIHVLTKQHWQFWTSSHTCLCCSLSLHTHICFGYSVHHGLTNQWGIVFFIFFKLVRVWAHAWLEMTWHRMKISAQSSEIIAAESMLVPPTLHSLNVAGGDQKWRQHPSVLESSSVASFPTLHVSYSTATIPSLILLLDCCNLLPRNDLRNTTEFKLFLFLARVPCK